MVKRSGTNKHAPRVGNNRRKETRERKDRREAIALESRRRNRR